MGARRHLRKADFFSNEYLDAFAYAVEHEKEHGRLKVRGSRAALKSNIKAVYPILLLSCRGVMCTCLLSPGSAR